MRALVIGRGSMGRRRIRDLGALGLSVASWDIADDAPLPIHPQLLVVCTPPLTHKQYGNAEVPTFMEADVEAVDAPHLPSATPLFTDWYAELSRWSYMAGYTLHVGQHLDDWHPGVDPATYYAYKEETGPTREMIPFELIWLTKLFGPVVRCDAWSNKNVAGLLVRHRYDVTGTILIDALSRPAIRRFTGIGYAGWQRSINLEYNETVYMREMRALVDAIEGRAPWPYSQSEEAVNLEVLHMIERTA